MPSSAAQYDKHAQQWAKRKKKGVHPAHDLLEKPAMYGLLPADISGLSVLCLGSGSGEECQEITSRGAQNVLGIDSSQGLIEQAQFTFPDLNFVCADIQTWNYPESKYDIVFSSLTLHYLENWLNLLSNIKMSLKPGGSLLFSTHHPVKWGAQSYRSKEKNQFLLGYTKSKQTPDYQIYGDYLTSRPIRDKLFGTLEITHYHKSISTMISIFQQAGFDILDMVEPLPLESSLKTHPDFYHTYSKIPLFVCWKLSYKV